MNKKKKQQISQLIASFGISSLKALAPIGDLGFANGWEEDDVEYTIYREAIKQGYKFVETEHDVNGYDTEYYCEPLGLYYHVCSN